MMLVVVVGLVHGVDDDILDVVVDGEVDSGLLQLHFLLELSRAGLEHIGRMVGILMVTHVGLVLTHLGWVLELLVLSPWNLGLFRVSSRRFAFIGAMRTITSLEERLVDSDELVDEVVEVLFVF
jgi:hypothetical protein